MAKKPSRIFQEQEHIEKTLLKNISEYRPTGDEDFDSLVRNHLLQDVHSRSDSFVQSLYDIAWNMTFGEWQDFWFEWGSGYSMQKTNGTQISQISQIMKTKTNTNYTNQTNTFYEPGEY